MAAAKRFFTGCRSLLAFLFRPLEGNAWLVATTLVACAILGVT